MLIRTAAALLAASSAAVAATPRMHVERGVVSRTAGIWQIAPCGASASPVAIGDATRGDLARVHARLARDPGTGVYMELTVEPGTEERGPRALAVRRAAVEARGCAETWAGERLRARGNEPSWSLTITAEAVTLDRPGAPLASGPTVEVRVSRTTRRYETRADQGPIVARVIERACSDPMSGERFPLAVEVNVGATVLKGCGAEPPSAPGAEGRPDAGVR